MPNHRNSTNSRRTYDVRKRPIHHIYSTDGVRSRWTFGIFVHATEKVCWFWYTFWWETIWNANMRCVRSFRNGNVWVYSPHISDLVFVVYLTYPIMRKCPHTKCGGNVIKTCWHDTNVKPLRNSLWVCSSIAPNHRHFINTLAIQSWMYMCTEYNNVHAYSTEYRWRVCAYVIIMPYYLHC